jgi:hypothetical protein
MKKEFIRFSKIEKENRWLIINDEEDDCFGQIYFYKKWKKYIVEFNDQIIWDDICLQKVTDFLKKLNKKGEKYE